MKKYSVAYYFGIAENPMVILLNRKLGDFKRQYDTIEDLKSDIGENAIIYFVADENDNRFELNNWHGGQFNFDKLLELAL